MPAQLSFEGNADWLNGSEGFLVESPAGYVGYVAEIQRDEESSQPRAIVVRGGKRGSHRVVVPVQDIAGVVPSRKLVLLQEAPA